MSSYVRIREEKVTFPTYRVGKPDRNPMFVEKRVYQGSSGVVYPYPMIESIENDPVDCQYQAYFLENEYIEVIVLPELGGRIQRARDKTNHYDFIYYNQVVKPALVGLAGPWISGGIEFNWPQHHRPNTYGPVSARIVKNPDGSETLWCGETDRMYGTRGLHGVTVHPDRALLEIRGRVYNPTPLPQTFLWWANPAVRVHDKYQSIFPPDVTAVMDHGKRAVSTFPIATGEYYKVDYSPGTDISWYKNLPVPTSYMAYKSKFDFVGGYDHSREAGLLHIADHHISPGKKQWTWGCGDFGQAWDRNLTNEDGPYFELMTGVYTDNQPDFTWLMPFEEKRFTQNFLPYKTIGHVRKATRDVAVSLEVAGREIMAGVYLIKPRVVSIVIRDGTRGSVLFQETLQLSPREAWKKTISSEHDLNKKSVFLEVYTEQKQLIQFSWSEVEKHPIPEPASPAPPPKDVTTPEELFLWASHMEQYRHATREPMEWYDEALSRDPMDMRANNAKGKLLLRRGKIAEAETFLRRAVEKSQSRNPNPYDGESLYNLGVCLWYQGNLRQAYDCFAKATWNAHWKAPAALYMARIRCAEGCLQDASGILQDLLDSAGRTYSARRLYIAVLRKLGYLDAARQELEKHLGEDPVDPFAFHEGKLLAGAEGEKRDEWLAQLHELIDRDLTHNLLEMAREYGAAGLVDELRDALSIGGDSPSASPMIYYHAGDREKARTADIDGVFPNRIEDLLVLKKALQAVPDDANALHLLGNLWYDKRQYDDAIACWEKARDIRPEFPTTHRNLGIAYFNKRGDSAAALSAYEKAFELNPSDARVFFEYDQLLKRTGHQITKRLDLLERHHDLTLQRDDLVLEHATLLNTLGRHQEALDILMNRIFHPWEGGEGKVTRQYVVALCGLARASIAAGNAEAAIALLNRTESYPHNLGEGKLYGSMENDVHYLRGLALESLGRQEDARAEWELATGGSSEPASAWFYNDQPPELIYYQGLAYQKIGNTTEANSRFQGLLDYGRKHLNDEQQIDFFAVSLPDFLVFEDDLERRNQIHCRLMMALGCAGLGRGSEALKQIDETLALDPSHQQAFLLRRDL